MQVFETMEPVFEKRPELLPVMVSSCASTFCCYPPLPPLEASLCNTSVCLASHLSTAGIAYTDLINFLFHAGSAGGAGAHDPVPSSLGG